MAQVLKVICDTYLKMRPALAIDLSEQEKLFVQTGSIFEVVSFSKEGEHYKVALKHSVSGLDIWFILQDHTEVIETDGGWDEFARAEVGVDARAGIGMESNTDVNDLPTQEQPLHQEEEPQYQESSIFESLQEFDPTNPDSGLVLGGVVGGVAGGMTGDAVFDDASGESIGGALGGAIARGAEHSLDLSYNPIESAPVQMQSAPVQTSSTIDLELKKLTSGKVLFDTPNYMKVGITERVSVGSIPVLH